MNQIERPCMAHCSVCGKTLGDRATSETVTWRYCYVDDSGIYCASCHIPKKDADVQELSESAVMSLFTGSQGRPGIDTLDRNGIP
jgi:hypothetical protein